MIRNICCLLLSALLSGTTVLAQEADRPLVYIIPIKDQIEPALLYVIRRGVDEAVREKADAIIFEMDTPGGRVDVTEKIISVITSTEIPTYTFIENQAFSAGAIISLATKHIYMAPGSVIGAATPLMMSPTGGVQDMPDEVKEKMTSGVAALIRSAAEQGGHNKELAEAMVRADMEYKIGEKVISEKGRLLTLTNEEAGQLVGDEQTPLLSEATVENVDALLKLIGYSDAEQRRLEITLTEKLARWIAAMAPFLMMIGLGGLWLEFKTPGFGVFGITGITCLLLFFFGHHIAGLAGMEDLLIFALGITLLAIEIFVIPGFGAAGISGIALILLSLVGAMVEHAPGEWQPISFSIDTFMWPLFKVAIAFVGSFLLMLAAARYLPETQAFKSIVLETAIERPDEDLDLIGLEGITHSDLRPAGSAYFDEQKLDVVSEGYFIARHTPVRIIEVHGNRIVVEDISHG